MSAQDDPLFVLYAKLRLLGFTSAALVTHEYESYIAGPHGYIRFRNRLQKFRLDLLDSDEEVWCDPEDGAAVLAMVINAGIATLPSQEEAFDVWWNCRCELRQ